MGGIFGCVGSKELIATFRQQIDESRGRKITNYVERPRIYMGIQHHSRNIDVHTTERSCLPITLQSDDNKASVACRLLKKSYISGGLERLIDVLSSNFCSDFALALYDPWKEILILSSDVFNIRKIYYYRNKGGFIYSQSLKHLVDTLKNLRILTGTLKDNNLNLQALGVYLVSGNFPLSSTVIHGVKKVAPASLLVFQIGNPKTRIVRYPDSLFINIPHPTDNLIEETYECLFDAVKRRSMLDAISGVPLSGGLDSSAICSLLSRIINQRNIFALNLSFGEFYSEISQAREVAEELDVKLVETKVDTDFEVLYPLFCASISLLDEISFRSSYLSRYIAIKELNKRSEVAFFGDGGDELFFGYMPRHWSWYNSFPFITARKLPYFIRRLGVRFMDLSLNVLDRSDLDHCTTLPSILTRIRDITDNIENPNCALHLYHSMMTPPSSINFLLPSINKSYSVTDSYLLSRVERFSLKDIPSKTSCLLMYLLIQSDISTIENISSRIGIKPRFPFLDLALAKHLYSIPPHLKFRDNVTKYLLREILRRFQLLPEKIITQQKGYFLQPTSMLFNSENCINIIKDNPLNHQSKIVRSLIRKALQTKDMNFRGSVMSFVKWLGNFYAN